MGVCGSVHAYAALPPPPPYRYAHGKKRGSSLAHPAHAGELRDGVAQRQQVQHRAKTFPSEITIQSRHDDLLSVVIRGSFAPLHEIRDELRLDVGVIPGAHRDAAFGESWK